MLKKLLAPAASFVILSLPTLASAHAFGQQYTLPLPFQFYALGACAALIASFMFLALYSEPDSAADSAQTYFSIPGWGGIEIFLRLIGAVGFIVTVACAFFGASDYNLNPAPELFWTTLMLGFTYLSVFVGGLWRFVSPFETFAKIFLLTRRQPHIAYPRQLSFLPALIFYFALIWLELLSQGAGAVPWIIGSTLIMYMMISILGADIFGVEEWFEYADFFTVFFGLMGNFAPIQIEQGGLRISAPVEHLITRKTGKLSLLVFILFMLSSTAFDGLEETQIWWSTLYHSAFQMQIYPFEKTAIFFASPFIFLALYASAIWLMRVVSRTAHNFRYLLMRFTFSLIPIAIAYNFAHYFTLLVNGTQHLYALVSDPLAKGWNIFGTAQYQINASLIGAREVWYAQFSAIVFGHIIATYVAHRIATREFVTQRQILLGQIPMLILMVFYTVFGLWILSQGYQTGA